MALFYCTTYQVWVLSIFVGVMPLLELRILELQFPGFFSNMHGHIELEFYISLCFTVLQIKFECCQFASIFVGVMPLLGLRILEIHSFPHFSPKCSDILSWDFSYDFVQCTIDQVRVSSLCIRLALCAFCAFLLHALTNLAENLFDVGFLNAFVLEKYYKNSLLKCSWRAYYAPFAVLRYIWEWKSFGW